MEMSWVSWSIPSSSCRVSEVLDRVRTISHMSTSALEARALSQRGPCIPWDALWGLAVVLPMGWDGGTRSSGMS